VNPDGEETEIDLLFASVLDLIDRLLNLARHIRSPLARKVPTGVEMDLYKDLSPEVKALVAEKLTTEQFRGLEHVFLQARKELQADSVIGVDMSIRPSENILIDRFCKANHVRRCIFAAWKRKKSKALHFAQIRAENLPTSTEKSTLPVKNVPATNKGAPVSERKPVQSLWSAPTTQQPLSVTFQIPDTISSVSTDIQSISVKVVGGVKIGWPDPPAWAREWKADFECPYCFFFCPAAFLKNKTAWR
jgi:hypothetical protein